MIGFNDIHTLHSYWNKKSVASKNSKSKYIRMQTSMEKIRQYASLLQSALKLTVE